MSAPRNLLTRGAFKPVPRPPAAPVVNDQLLAALAGALASLTDKHLQEALEEANERAGALDAQLAANQATIEAVRTELATTRAQMQDMAGAHAQALLEIDQRHTEAIRGIRVTGGTPDLGPVLAQIQQAMGVSLSALSDVVGKMDIRVTAMARDFAALPAPPTELEFDVIDDGAGGNVRIIARGKK